MAAPVLFSIIESPTHPYLSPLYEQLGIDEIKYTSTRKAITALKEQAPDFVVAEFFYGYGNNYAGVNVSNLDVFLHSLQKYSTETKVIVMVDKSEYKFVEKLAALFPLHAVLQQPVQLRSMEAVLTA